MKNLTYILLMFFPMSVLGETICPEYKSEREPEFSWQESDFTEKAASDALHFLQGVLHENKKYEWISLPNSQILISGYIHKREALKSIQEKSVMESYYVSKFCTFLQNTVRYD